MIERRGPGGAPVRQVVIDRSVLTRLPDHLRLIELLAPDSPGRRLLDGLCETLFLARPGIVPAITLVTREEQVMTGLPRQFRDRVPERAPLRYSFCKHVVASGVDVVVPDAAHYPPSCHRAAVRDTGARAYLGTPLRDQRSAVVGAACMISFSPTAWDVADMELVRGFARAARTILDLVEDDAATRRSDPDPVGAVRDVG